MPDQAVLSIDEWVSVPERFCGKGCQLKPDHWRICGASVGKVGAAVRFSRSSLATLLGPSSGEGW